MTLAPEMSAAGIADAVVKAVGDTAFDVVIVNFANADMVGHSGKMEATVRAVEVVDRELGRIYRAVKQRGGALLVTADHGNAEMLIDPATGGPHTAHTTNPVPFLLVTDEKGVQVRDGGSLRDISPTMLGLLGMEKPGQMTGGIWWCGRGEELHRSAEVSEVQHVDALRLQEARETKVFSEDEGVLASVSNGCIS